jgi:PTH1 family peptidyl-tRNA hydrolase
MKLIVGLGNPGRSYVNNRHNVGYRCLDYIARKHDIQIRQRRARSHLGLGSLGDTKVMLVKPRTFMNLSGEAVGALMRYNRVPVKDLLVICDDLDLPLGKIRIRERGSSGGHKGVKSIIAHVGSQDFPRVRVGIAPLRCAGESPSHRIDAVERVLSDFNAEEKTVIREVYPRVAAAVECLLAEGIAAAMNTFN